MNKRKLSFKPTYIMNSQKNMYKIKIISIERALVYSPSTLQLVFIKTIFCFELLLVLYFVTLITKFMTHSKVLGNIVYFIFDSLFSHF